MAISLKNTVEFKYFSAVFQELLDFEGLEIFGSQFPPFQSEIRHSSNGQVSYTRPNLPTNLY